ncbi:MAG: S8 family serine peptidase [Thermodesulfobacteriota bacterium]
MDPGLKELIEEGEGADEIEVILKLRHGDDVPPHVRIVTRFGDIATCRLRRDRILETWEQEECLSVKASRLVEPEPEFIESDAASESENYFNDSRRPQSLEATGRGVVVGIADWGLDFAHPNFRKDDGSTRLLALWDQGNTTAVIKPAPYRYGVAYSHDEINRALESPRPYETLGYHPAESDTLDYGAHGTHVCDIAVGNGRAGASPVGIAPEADIVFVNLATRGISGLANLGDSVRILEALDFIAKIAGHQPWVVNLSLGRCGGPHTGLTLVEQGIDALLLQAPGRAIVQSTGNYFDERIHAAGQLRPGQKRTLTWWTDKADFTPNELEVWYSGRDSLILEVRLPESDAVFHVPLGKQRSIQIEGREVGRIYHRAHDPSNGDNHVDIFLYPSAPAGLWRINLIGEDIVDGRFHCWVERDSACRGCQSRFDPNDAISSSTTGTICNGFRTIAVGAYNPHSPGLELGSFSSSGPTMDGRQKPDLIAPGVRILAARSASREQPVGAPMLTRKSGTSMASPHVTGTVACMFEASQRPLWIHETRNLLLGSTQSVAAPPETAVRIGSGYLDIEKAVEAAGRVAKDEIHLYKRDCLTSRMYPFSSGKTVSVAGEQTDAQAFIGRVIDEQPSYLEEKCGCQSRFSESALPSDSLTGIDGNGRSIISGETIQEADGEIIRESGIMKEAVISREYEGLEEEESDGELLEADGKRPITGMGRGYLAGKYGLELDGKWAGWLRSFEGGHAVADVIHEKLVGPGQAIKKHIGSVKYEDITVTFSTGMSKLLYDWIKDTLDRKYTRKNGAIIIADYEYKVKSRLEFKNALIKEIGFPSLDAASKEPGKLTIKFSPEYTSRSVPPGGPTIKVSATSKVQKEWLVANFHLTIGDLDCKKVSRIESIAVKLKVIESSLGEKEPQSYLEIPNLVVTLPESDAKTWFDWYEDFVIKGNSGEGREKNGILEYLSSNLKEVPFTLTFQRLGIFKLTSEKAESGEGIRRVKGEMYCEDMKFEYKAVQTVQEIVQEMSWESSRNSAISSDAAINGENKYMKEEGVEEYEEGFEEYEEALKKRNFVLISGGPGLFDDRDVEHDKSWANYVTPPLLLTDTEEKRKKFAQADEDVWWFVYKPAYESRWGDDLKVRRKSTKKIKDEGFVSYIDKIEKRAKKRGWNLRWLNSADDLWKELKTFRKGSISRLWYWGHARDDLWLSLGHSSASEAVAPESHEIVLVSSIDSKLRDRFQKGDPKRIHRFVGCNTSAFSRVWSKTFKVWSEGVEEKVDFAAIHETGGEPSLVGEAKIKFFSPKGIEAGPTEAWQVVEVAAVEDSSAEESDDELLEAEVAEIKVLWAEELDDELLEEDEVTTSEISSDNRDALGSKFIALAEGVVHGGKVAVELSRGGLLRKVLSEAGMTENISPLGHGSSFPSPAAIFEAFTPYSSPALRRHFEQFFEVIANPGEVLEATILPGDILLRRAFGEGRLAQAAFLVGETAPYQELKNRGWMPEGNIQGHYALSIENGAFPHCLHQRFARRITNESGCLSHDQMIIRVRPEGLVADELAILEDLGFGLLQEATPLLTVRVRNRIINHDAVPMCNIELVGTNVRGTTSAAGSVNLNLTGAPDGTYTLRIIPPNHSADPIGPAIASTSSPPDRIWRALDATVTVRGERLVGTNHSDVTLSGGRLTVKLQPVWMKAANSSARSSSAISHITLCVVHHTGGPRASSAINWFLNSKGPSAHYVIDSDGQIIKMVHESRQSWHAGRSHWGGRDSVNDFSIGIELVHRDGAYPAAQYTAVIELLRRIRNSHTSIPANGIVGHSDIATTETTPRRLGRKAGDPGLQFDWATLETGNLGIPIRSGTQPASIYGGFFAAVPNGRVRRGDNDAKKVYSGSKRPAISDSIISELQTDLTSIGYFSPVNGSFGVQTEWAVRMFQERFLGGSRTRATHPGQVDQRTAQTIKSVRPTVGSLGTSPGTEELVVHGAYSDESVEASLSAPYMPVSAENLDELPVDVGADVSALPSINPQDVIDERIDVIAQRSILRLNKGEPAARQDAARLLAGVKAGQLAGIFGENLLAAAKLAKKLGTVRWELVPKGEDAALILDPGAPTVAPPTIIFRVKEKKPPGKKVWPMPPERMDPALQKASRTFELWQRGQLVPCASNPSATPVPNLVPASFCHLTARDLLVVVTEAPIEPSLPGSPVSGARVQVEGPSPSVGLTAQFTDETGLARFLNLADGTYRVTTSKKGFEEASTEISHPSNQAQAASFVGHSALGVPRPVHMRLKRALHRFTPGRWFLSSLVRPITHNNQVKVYVKNVGDVWGDMRQAIERATNSGRHFIYLTGWQLGLDTEMGPPGSPTLRKLLEEASDDRNIQVRGLLYRRQFQSGWNKDVVEFINGVNGGQAFLDDRYLVAGSHHQKLLLVNNSDGLVGFCGSMDIHPSRRHWHEVHFRVTGPAARDLHDTFADRWKDLPSGLVQKRPLMLLTGLLVGPGAGTADVQVVRTYGNGSAHRGIGVNPVTTNPEGYTFAPQGEHTIYDLIENAIEQAEVYIYLEDQYLTCCEDMNHGVAVSKLLAAKLKAAREGSSHLQKLIILVARTCQVNGEIRQCWQRRKKFLDALKAEDDPANPRLVVVQYKAKHNVFIHSKTWIFDDELAIIGSANCNRRGYSHDSELGVGIVDRIPPDPTGEVESLPRKIRMDLWHKHLSPALQASMTNVSLIGVGLDRRALFDPTKVFHLWESLDPKGKLEYYNDATSEVNKCPEGDIQGTWFGNFVGTVLPRDMQWDNIIDPDGS